MNKICVNCGKEYECYDKGENHGGLRSVKLKRALNSVNCSTKCSREHEVKYRLNYQRNRIRK